MRIKWKMDKVAWNTINHDLDSSYLNFIERLNNNPFVLDVGGNNGWMTENIAEYCELVVNLDLNRQLLKMNPKHIATAEGIVQNCPFKDGSFDGIHARGVLHHAPEDLNICLREMNRILRKDGILFIQDPTSTNPFAHIARKIFPTIAHDPEEQPFNPKYLTDSVSELFDVESVRYYFIFSYLLPHIISRMPLKSLWRKVCIFFYSLDKYLLEKFPSTRKYAAFIEIMAMKK